MQRWFTIAGALAVAASLAACGSSGSGATGGTGQADDATVDSSDSGATGRTGQADDATVESSGEVVGVIPEGFTTATLTVTKPDGEVCEWCVWLADSSAERARGLMGVTDLGVPVGMAFAYDSPSEGSFYMYRTVTPLSIAWFRDGDFVGATNMAPCTEDDGSDCARYSPGTAYTLAVEVPQGELVDYGLIPGSTAEVQFDSEGPDCQV